jgi:polyphenol oxidase
VTATALQRIRTVREVAADGLPFPLYVHPEWAAEFPWLVQGTTARGAADAFDLGFFAGGPLGAALERWCAIRHAADARTVVHARQVHGAAVLRHGAAPAGIFLGDDADGHVTREPGVLLTVSVADCVPISIVDPDERSSALLHGGWRGVAAGIVEAGLRALLAMTDGDVADLRLHVGPAICGECYEVGPEVHEALGMPAVAAPQPVNLRHVIIQRAAFAGLHGANMTISEHCTRCGDSPFFSHRGGDAGRQMGLLGIRETSAREA